jgi:hypothetical protein
MNELKKKEITKELTIKIDEFVKKDFNEEQTRDFLEGKLKELIKERLYIES